MHQIMTPVNTLYRTTVNIGCLPFRFTKTKPPITKDCLQVHPPPQCWVWSWRESSSWYVIAITGQSDYDTITVGVFLDIYGTGVIRPNHHYATHVAECVRNFGPLHDFWMFLYERLNKVLKSFKTNNHGQGELETTFFTEFQKTCQTSHLVRTQYHTLHVTDTVMEITPMMTGKSLPCIVKTGHSLFLIVCSYLWRLLDVTQAVNVAFLWMLSQKGSNDHK